MCVPGFILRFKDDALDEGQCIYAIGDIHVLY